MTQHATTGASAPSTTRESVLTALRDVVDPELHDNVVDLGIVRSVEVAGSEVRVAVALTVASCPLRAQIRDDVERRVLALAGVERVAVSVGVMGADERAALMDRARHRAQDRAVDTGIPSSARVLAVGSGKGGVGKSSVSVNLSVALAARGHLVGVLDADIWGFSVPRMLGLSGPLDVVGGKMRPVALPVGSGELRVVSMGFLSGEDGAILWRGLVLARALQHFLEDVAWGELDYLVVDMPPGTGDVQMALARMLPRAELLVVTTPASGAEKVAGRAADMARRGHLRVAGVVENMSGFVCDHGARYALFGSGGGERLAEAVGVPLLGTVPLDPTVAARGDTGSPVALDGSGPAASAFRAIAERIAVEVAPVVQLAGCSARMLARVEDAVGPAPTRG